MDTTQTEATILANPAAEIQAMDRADEAAWKRWEAYDRNWIAARKLGKVPWIGTIEVYGWAPYRNMLNQRTEMSALGNEWFFPVPSQLAAMVGPAVTVAPPTPDPNKPTVPSSPFGPAPSPDYTLGPFGWVKKVS